MLKISSNDLSEAGVGVCHPLSPNYIYTPPHPRPPPPFPLASGSRVHQKFNPNRKERGNLWAPGLGKCPGLISTRGDKVERWGRGGFRVGGAALYIVWAAYIYIFQCSKRYHIPIYIYIHIYIIYIHSNFSKLLLKYITS